MKRLRKKPNKSLKKTFKLSRTVHIYLSSALFALMLFFSFTGFTLNHTDWFSSKAEESIYETPLPESLIININDPSIDQLKAFLKTEYGLMHMRSVDIDDQDKLVSMDFPLPDGYAFATFYLEDNVLEVEYKNGSGIALLNDLHKGRHTGAVWSWIIDLCAWLFCLFSITGFILIFQNKKHRRYSIMASLLGTITPVILFFIFVPHFYP